MASLLTDSGMMPQVVESYEASGVHVVDVDLLSDNVSSCALSL